MKQTNLKMRTLLFYSTTILSVTLLITSCKKTDSLSEITPHASISITSPFENQKVKKGDTLSIIGKISAPANIHGYKLFIIKNGLDTVFGKDEHIHGMDVNILQTWVNDLSANADLQLVIIATLDHEGNTANKKVIFKNITE
jgi:hypothetical protein